MQQVYEAGNFDDQPLQCSRCGWEGKGSDANLIDFYGLSEYQEAQCPQCDTTLAQVKQEDTQRGESPDQTGFQIG